VALLPEGLAPEAWNFEVGLGGLGFGFEPFGEGAARISAVPETVTDPEAALLAAPYALAGGEDLSKALACKGSTKFGEGLSAEEAKALLRDWASCEFRETCAPRAADREASGDVRICSGGSEGTSEPAKENGPVEDRPANGGRVPRSRSAGNCRV
jgi:hypothetical protein